MTLGRPDKRSRIPIARRPTNAIVPPEYFESGTLGKQTSVSETYFTNPDAEEATRMVIDNFVRHLPEWKRSAVQMCIMANMTYEEAAQEISTLRGKRTDKKTVWRWAKAGVEDMKSWLMKSPWAAHMTNKKIPIEALDASRPVSLPWEQNDGS